MGAASRPRPRQSRTLHMIPHIPTADRAKYARLLLPDSRFRVISAVTILVALSATTATPMQSLESLPGARHFESFIAAILYLLNRLAGAKRTLRAQHSR